MVAIDVLERLVARVAHAAMYLHGSIGCFAAQAVCPVIAHGDLIGERSLDLLFGERVHRELNRLIFGQRPAEGFALSRIFDTLVDTIDRSAKRTRRLANPILMDEALRERQSASDLAELRILRYEHVGKANARMISRHIERPHIFLNLYAGALRGYQKTADAVRIA